jgi:hypothetical protein
MNRRSKHHEEKRHAAEPEDERQEMGYGTKRVPKAHESRRSVGDSHVLSIRVKPLQFNDNCP